MKRFLQRLLAALRRRRPRLRSYIFFAGPPQARLAGAVEKAGARMVEITPENLDRALAFRKADIVRLLGDYLERGCRGWFAELDGEVAAYAFLAVPGEGPEKFRRVRVYPGEAGGILFYTRPEFRSTGVGTAMIRELSALAGEAGARSYVLWTVPSNEGWTRPLRRWGLEPAGRAWIFELWGRPVLRIQHGTGVRR